MIKKIITMSAVFFLGMVFAAIAANDWNSTRSNKTSKTSSVEVDNSGVVVNENIDPTSLMVEFDGLVDGVKKEDNKIDNCICTLEYAPVCGQQDEDQITFGNKCEFDCKAKNGKIKFLHNGKCEEGKKDGKILGPPKKIMPVSAEVKVGSENNLSGSEWVKVDNTFSFNVKTTEWKDGHGICHTCTPENGFTKDGEIIVDGDVEAPTNFRKNEEENKLDTNFVDRFQVKVVSDKSALDDEDESESSTTIFFGGKSVETDAGLNVKTKEGSLFVADVEVKIDSATAEEKAKSSTFADIVLSSRIEEENGQVNYAVETQRSGKFLGIFDFNLNTEVKIDVKTGAVVDIDEPWYSFLIF